MEIASDNVCDVVSAVNSEPEPFLFGQAGLGLFYTLAEWKFEM